MDGLERVKLWRVLEGEGGGTMANTPDGPKWTAWSVARWRDRGLGVSGCVAVALRTALNGRPRV